MSKFQYIKSREQMATELHNLWDNFPLYKFINGSQWIRKREIEICHCLTQEHRDDWIELCRITWQQKQTNKKKP